MFTRAPAPEITVRDTALELAGPSPPLLLDCRGENEWTLCHINGAQLIPLPQLERRLHDVSAQAGERAIIVYCHTGRRSLVAANILRAAGLDAKSMRGGVDAWSREIDASVPRY